MMRWYKDIQTILTSESETWLAYLFGRQLENIPHMSRAKPRFRGLVFQLAKFFLHLLRHLRLKLPRANNSHAKFLFFAGTLNQMHSLDTTIDSLRHRGEAVVAVAPAKFIKGQSGKPQYIPFEYSLLDVCKALFLLFRRGPSLYRELKNVHPIAMSWYFANFCATYSYLSSFHRILRQFRPEYVVTSNDHNVPNRCLLAVAHHLGIETVYLQHASVSTLFPALRVNYAFLDGQCALDTYEKCEPNQPPTIRSVPVPRVLLTGLKKRITRSVRGESAVVGVALNALDDVDAAIKFVRIIAEAGLKVLVRWHPGQTERDARRYTIAFTDIPAVSLSDPKTEPVSEFMARIGWLVAGSSSIHLEAALAGVMPIYFELTPVDSPDYYGYVERGLAQAAKSPAEVIRLVESTRGDHRPNEDIVRYYSATYLTEWDGREGELVAECLSRISQGGAPPIEMMELGRPISPDGQVMLKG